MIQNPERTLDVLVIGARMAGLTAGTELQCTGRRVLVRDRGRGLGGRIASRRFGGATFDHGAQFITTRDPRFVAALEGWRRSGVVAGFGTFQVHGWRYSKPMWVHEQAFVLASQSPPLVLAGDAFAGPKVEGAALSGWAAAEAILKSRL